MNNWPVGEKIKTGPPDFTWKLSLPKTQRTRKTAPAALIVKPF